MQETQIQEAKKEARNIIQDLKQVVHSQYALKQVSIKQVRYALSKTKGLYERHGTIHDYNKLMYLDRVLSEVRTLTDNLYNKGNTN